MWGDFGSGSRRLAPRETSGNETKAPVGRTGAFVGVRENGQGGIRTRGTADAVRRFSKPVPSAARPPVPRGRIVAGLTPGTSVVTGVGRSFLDGDREQVVGAAGKPEAGREGRANHGGVSGLHHDSDQ